jgi:hypothetical protein
MNEVQEKEEWQHLSARIHISQFIEPPKTPISPKLRKDAKA